MQGSCWGGPPPEKVAVEFGGFRSPPRASNPRKFSRPEIFLRGREDFLGFRLFGGNLRMAQSRRHERPRSSRLQHSASFRAGNPNKASMTLMLAAASICATDALERQLAPPGFQCCERDLLGRSKPRDWAMRDFSKKLPFPKKMRFPIFYESRKAWVWG